jgi:hypothetical protein
MNRLLSGLILFCIASTAIITYGFTTRYSALPPEIVSARAAQEQAKAEKLQAEAEIQSAAAARSWVTYHAYQSAQPAIEFGIRLAAFGSGIAVFILACGVAFAVATWSITRARVVYPNASGQMPVMVRQPLLGAGETLITNTNLLLSPVTIISADGQVSYPLPASEQSALLLATQSQAGNVVVGVANKTTSQQAVKRVNEVSERLPVPTFESSNDARQFVYVKGKDNSKVARDRKDLREFIERGYRISFHRSDWVAPNYTFRGTGRECRRGYFDHICGVLQKANIIADDGDGWEPVVELAEALDAFNLAHDETQEVVTT